MTPEQRETLRMVAKWLVDLGESNIVTITWPGQSVGKRQPLFDAAAELRAMAEEKET